ncbi:MAG: hypothetical protein ACOYOK_07470 [Pseudobdellovibrionaceae bacterium]
MPSRHLLKTIRVLAIALFLGLTSVHCNKSNSNNNAPTPTYPTAYGTGSSIRGVVTIGPQCNTSVATITLGDTYGGQGYFNTQAPNGGTFDFQTNAGQYVLSARAGNCTVSQTISITGNYAQTFQVCLGPQCQGYSPYNGGLGGGFYKTGTCIYGDVGCLGTIYPGSGDLTVQNSHIYFQSTSDSNATLSLSVFNAANILMTQPGWENAAWSFQLKKQGTLTFSSSVAGASAVSYDSLLYSARVKSSDLQFTSGFCDKKESIVGRMKDYLKAYAYSATTQSEFTKEWSERLPNSSGSELCVYPQEQSIINKVINYQSANNLETRRIWFVVTPLVSTADAKAGTKFKNFAKLSDSLKTIAQNKPAQTAFAVKPKAVAKKEDHTQKNNGQNRAIATDASITAEEVGLVFLLE